MGPDCIHGDGAKLDLQQARYWYLWSGDEHMYMDLGLVPRPIPNFSNVTLPLFSMACNTEELGMGLGRKLCDTHLLLMRNKGSLVIIFILQ